MVQLSNILSLLPEEHRDFLAVPIREAARLGTRVYLRLADWSAATASLYRIHYAPARLPEGMSAGIYVVENGNLEPLSVDPETHLLAQVERAASELAVWYDISPGRLHGAGLGPAIGVIVYTLAREGIAVDPLKLKQSLQSIGLKRVRFGTVPLYQNYRLVLLGSDTRLAAVAPVDPTDAVRQADNPLSFLRDYIIPPARARKKAR